MRYHRRIGQQCEERGADSDSVPAGGDESGADSLQWGAVEKNLRQVPAGADGDTGAADAVDQPGQRGLVAGETHGRMGEGAEMNIIFDMDGVIFDTERMYLACCVPAAEKLGLDGIEKVSYECIGLTETESNKKLLAFIGNEALLDEFNQEMYRIFMERYEADGLPLKEGAAELLAYLKGAGESGACAAVARTAIASSTRSDIVEMELRDAGLLGYFDVIVGGEMAGASKPEPDIFLLAAERLGLAIEDGKIAEKCFVIEDSFNGVRAAHAAGATVLMVPDLLKPTEEILALTDHVFDSLVDVQAWLENEVERR